MKNRPVDWPVSTNSSTGHEFRALPSIVPFGGPRDCSDCVLGVSAAPFVRAQNGVKASKCTLTSLLKVRHKSLGHFIRGFLLEVAWLKKQSGCCTVEP